MFYETAHTIGPGWQRSYKPNHYEDMTWSPSSKHFRSPGSSPQSYRRIYRSEDIDRPNSDENFFGRSSTSPTFPRKVFRDVWEDSPPSNHRFADRPRLFKRVFKPSRWEDDDDFERTRSTVRQMARDFDPDFEVQKINRDFDPDFHHRERDLKSDIEEEFEKAAGRVHHIPIMVEKRLKEMRSRFDKPQEEPEKSEDWQGPQVHRLKKNFERNDYSPFHDKHCSSRIDPNKTRAYTSPIPSRWEAESTHTLPSRKAGFKNYDENTATSPKSVYRSFSETHEDIPKYHQQQHPAAFRSHSDGHCPQNTYVTKITVNGPPSTEKETHSGEPSNRAFKDEKDSNSDGWDSHKSRQKSNQENVSNTSEGSNDNQHEATDTEDKKTDDKSPKRTPLQQISAVLQNVEDLLVHVDAYNGSGRDKQYRFLDEMLTRCILRLDDIDTEGQEEIRTARKAAVMQIQAYIEKLELKADECERRKHSEDNDQTSQNPAPKDEDNGQEISNPEKPLESKEFALDHSEDAEQTRL